jgi:hypothetical protein
MGHCKSMFRINVINRKEKEEECGRVTAKSSQMKNIYRVTRNKLNVQGELFHRCGCKD